MVTMTYKILITQTQTITTHSKEKNLSLQTAREGLKTNKFSNKGLTTPTLR